MDAMNGKILHVIHRTSYRYEEPVTSCCNLGVLLPRPLPWQDVVSESLYVEPHACEMDERPDMFGNRTTWFRIDKAHTEFIVESNVDVALHPREYPKSSLSWKQTMRQLRDPSQPRKLELLPYLFPSPYVQWGSGIQQWTREFGSFEGTAHDLAQRIMERIRAESKFDKEATKVGTTVEEMLKLRRGVCQDFSHWMVAALRHLGIPARYASGYLETQPPPGQPKPVGTDVSHAWVSVWDGEASWIDFDPTNSLIVGDRHVTIAYGRDFGDVCPLKGVLEDGGKQTLEVSVDVRA